MAIATPAVAVRNAAACSGQVPEHGHHATRIVHYVSWAWGEDGSSSVRSRKGAAHRGAPRARTVDLAVRTRTSRAVLFRWIALVRTEVPGL